MAVDVSKIPNSRNFDSVREAILELDDSISDTGSSVNNSQITITAGTNLSLSGGGVFTLNQSNDDTITINADDQTLTDAEVKTAYENNSDTNAFTDAEKTKLGNISSIGSGSIITSAERTKLTSIEESADVTDTANVTTAINSISVTAHSDVSDAGSGFIITANERTKLTNIEAGADVTDANNVAAAGAIMDGDFTSNGLMKRTGVGTYSTATASDINALNVDADTLDGNDSTHYLDYNNLNNKPTLLNTEDIQDVVGGQFVTNGVHTGISFSYDDANDGAIDATISSDYKTKDQFIGGSRLRS